MHAVIAHAPNLDVQDVRRALHGSGADCGKDDCVAWNDLTVRLARGNTDLIVVRVDANHETNWKAITEARVITSASLIAIGPADNATEAERARQAGAVAYVNEADMNKGLDAVLDRMDTSGSIPRRRGVVISVFAPTPGSGGSTVASNLAGTLAQQYPDDVALIELTRHVGDLALLLDVTPVHTTADACQRSHQLDTVSLRNIMVEHSSGVRLLAAGMEAAPAEHLTVEAIQRLAVLTRVAFGASVFALDSRLVDEEIEAMRLSDSVALVIRPDVPSVRRAQWAVEQAVQRGVPRERFRLVINRWGQRGQLSRNDVEETIGLQATQLIPDDPARVNRATNRGQLLLEVARHAGINRRFATLAKALNGKVA